MTLVLISVFVGILLLGLLVWCLLRAAKRHIRRREELLRQELDQQHEQKLIRSVLNQQEEERKNLAIDLHDNLNSLLLIARINLHMVSREQQSEAGTDLITKSIGQIDEALDVARRITRSLSPHHLETMGLAVAVTDLCHRLGSGKVRVVFEEDQPQPYKAPKEKTIHIYRIIQEILSNYIKHSDGTIIQINFYWQPHLTICIVDNGKPFQYQLHHTTTEGIGVGGIRSRLQVLHASFDSLAGSPNTTIITIPMG